MGRAIYRTYTDFIFKPVPFPENTKIVDVGSTVLDRMNGWIMVILEHDDLPATEPGKLMKQCKPTFKTIDNKDVFIEWNVCEQEL